MNHDRFSSVIISRYKHISTKPINQPQKNEFVGKKYGHFIAASKGVFYFKSGIGFCNNQHEIAKINVLNTWKMAYYIDKFSSLSFGEGWDEV